MIPVLKDATTSSRTNLLVQSLSQYADDREADIETIGLTKHEEFLGSVSQLQRVREGTVALTGEILELNQSIQASTEKLAEQKQGLVNTRAVRQNIADASDALKESLQILHAVNNAHDLIRKKKYYGALKSLEDLQNEYLVPTIQNMYATQHRLADLIQKSIPASQKTISEAVMTDLNTWLFRIRETSQFLGEVAFYHTELRRTRQRERVEKNKFLKNFQLNSAIELVFDESEEFDVLDNEELQVDFTPLFECLHIHEALGQSDKLRSDYAATRRQQKDLLMPNSVNLEADDESSLSSLLEGITGFAIIEKATMRRVPQIRSSVDVGYHYRQKARPGSRVDLIVGGRAVGLDVPYCHKPHLQSPARRKQRGSATEDQGRRRSFHPDDGGKAPADSLWPLPWTDMSDRAWATPWRCSTASCYSYLRNMQSF